MSVQDIFVFGSNLAGRHGKGAAKFALQHCGAVYGQGIGWQGNSYAIPTKDRQIKTLPLVEIQKYVLDFLDFAWDNTGMKFNVTRIGCGLAGYTDQDIAPMFESVLRWSTPNVILPTEFMAVLRHE